MDDLWASTSVVEWRAALDRYDETIAAQEVSRLAELDRWYREELPAAIRGRATPHVTHDELVRVTEWKMKRGAWRARNLVLVRGNEPEAVREASERALSAMPDPAAPLRELTKLAGVGPATASAVLAAAAPETYPFLEDLVAERIEGLGEVAYTMKYYRAYASALRARAAELGDGWTATDVERALWAASGGKVARSR